MVHCPYTILINFLFADFEPDCGSYKNYSYKIRKIGVYKITTSQNDSMNKLK